MEYPFTRLLNFLFIYDCHDCHEGVTKGSQSRSGCGSEAGGLVLVSPSRPYPNACHGKILLICRPHVKIFRQYIPRSLRSNARMPVARSHQSTERTSIVFSDRRTFCDSVFEPEPGSDATAVVRANTNTNLRANLAADVESHNCSVSSSDELPDSNTHSVPKLRPLTGSDRPASATTQWHPVGAPDAASIADPLAEPDKDPDISAQRIHVRNVL